jgi:hypothetical protein
LGGCVLVHLAAQADRDVLDLRFPLETPSLSGKPSAPASQRRGKGAAAHTASRTCCCASARSFFLRSRSLSSSMSRLRTKTTQDHGVGRTPKSSMQFPTSPAQFPTNRTLYSPRVSAIPHVSFEQDHGVWCGEESATRPEAPSRGTRPCDAQMASPVKRRNGCRWLLASKEWPGRDGN